MSSAEHAPKPEAPALRDRLQLALASAVRRAGARAYLALALVFTLVIAVDLWGVGLLDSADTKLFDTLVSKRLRYTHADPEIVIVDIDEASLAGMAPEFGRWPWPNQVMGELVQGIEQQKPRAIVFDILFSDPDVQRPQSDAAFNAAIERSSTTFFPVLRLDPQNDALSRIPIGAIPGVRPLLPDSKPDPDRTVAMILPKVPAALDNGRLGSHQVWPDKDGIIRRYPAWVEVGGWGIPSLPQRIAEEFNFAGSPHRDVLLNWRGPPFSYTYVPFVQAYRQFKPAAPQAGADAAVAGANTAQATDSEASAAQPFDFHNKIVLIGSTAPSLFDVKGTPIAHIHPGVEILATAIDNFRHGDYLHERPAWVMSLVALLLIWGMALALYKQVRIEVFDKVFGVLQAALVGLAFVVLNLSHWYIDTSAPLSLGLMYFAICRVYWGLSHKWLADGQVRSLSLTHQGQRLLGVMAVRLDRTQGQERRRLKGHIDTLVAQSKVGAARISQMVEDPGFVQSVFEDVMLVYWLTPDPHAPWQDEAQHMREALGRAFVADAQLGRLHFAQAERQIDWQEAHGWTAPAFATILQALQSLSDAPPQNGSTSPA